MAFRVAEILRSIAELNSRLTGEGDQARVKYVSVEHDPDFDAAWLILLTWQLPEPPGGAETWPLEELDHYCALAAESLAASNVTVECLFRTEEELQHDAKLGEPVPELTELT